MLLRLRKQTTRTVWASHPINYILYRSLTEEDIRVGSHGHSDQGYPNTAWEPEVYKSDTFKWKLCGFFLTLCQGRGRSFLKSLLQVASCNHLYCFPLSVPAHLFPTMAAGHLLGLISLEPLHPCSPGCFTAHSPRSTFMTPPSLSNNHVCHVYSTPSVLPVKRSASKSWPQTTSISCCHSNWLSAKVHIPDLSDCSIVYTLRHSTYTLVEKMRANSDLLHSEQTTSASCFTQRKRQERDQVTHS